MAWATIMIMKKGSEVQMAAVEHNEYKDNEDLLQSTIIER